MSGGESLAEPIRLLVVEDDEVDRLAVMRSIRAADTAGKVEVQHVGDASSALAILGSHVFDCVLLDYRLPDGDALSLLSDWQESGAARIPVVVLTGLDEEGIAIQTLQKGAQDYLVKGSIPGDVLLRSIRYAIERFRIQGQLEKANEQLERLAFLDPLTEMLNRRGLEHVLLADLGRASRDGLPLFTILVDCDDFKSVNDTFGHDIGDLLLKEVSSRIRASVRTTDHVGRIGGDEFLVLLPGARHGEAIRLAERVRQAVGERPVAALSHTIQKTISLGVFPVPADTRSITDLLAHADGALRRSKLAGKNRVSEAENGSPSATGPHAETLSQFLERDAIRVFSQRIVELPQGAEVGTEFFVQGPKGPLEKAEDFFVYCLQKNILTSVDLQCFRACIDGTAAFAKGRRHLNLYWSTLMETRVEEILDMLPRERKGQVCIELSVQHIIGDPQKLTRTRAALREAGVLLALDQADFGRATLEALIVLEPDMAKIDRGLVASAAADPLMRGALERLTRAARILKVDLIAVGIEHAADLDLLQTLDVKYGQGFLWGPPSQVLAKASDVTSSSEFR